MAGVAIVWSRWRSGRTGCPATAARSAASSAARSARWRPGCFQVATQQGYLSVAAVITSLYPAFTVLLAALVLREQVHRTQAVGLAFCAASVVLVAVG